IKSAVNGAVAVPDRDLLAGRKDLRPVEADVVRPERERIIVLTFNQFQVAQLADDGLVAQDRLDRIDPKALQLAGDFTVLVERADLDVRLNLPAVDPHLEANEVARLRIGEVDRAFVSRRQLR